MEYKDIKFVIGKAFCRTEKLKMFLGAQSFAYTQTMQDGYRYALWYIVDFSDNIHIVYTNFKENFPLWKIPYKKPSINNTLPL